MPKACWSCQSYKTNEKYIVNVGTLVIATQSLVMTSLHYYRLLVMTSLY